VAAITVTEPTRALPWAPRVPGWALRRVGLVLGSGLAAAWLASNRHELHAALAAVAGVTPGWLLVAVGTAIAAQVAAAAALHAVAPAGLGFGRTCRIQLAGTAAAAVTPGGVGGAALHALELERAGSTRARSWAAVVAVRTVTFLLHLLALAASLPLVQRTVLPTMETPAWLPLVLVAATMLLGAGASRSAPLRRKMASLWARRPPAALLRQRAGTLTTGAGATTLARGLTLWAALQAAGGRVPVLALLALFLAADAAGALSGAPNGLGAFDVVVLAGLEATGIAVSATVAALVLYRLLTAWLPVLPGLAALAGLRRGRATG
jgi:uncharacterized membrane protein YbhN (UPF0104 family)